MQSLIGPDGQTLALQDWPLPPGAAARGVVLVLHGLGEHMERYAHVAERLNAWGFHVRAYDQFGHGQSSGARGTLPAPTRLLDDLVRVLDWTRSAYPGLPLVLLGHSMGGLVAAYAAALQLRPLDGLVLSSPALSARLNPLQKALIAVLPHLVPNLAVGNGLDSRYLSHDAAVCAAYDADLLCHDRISPRLARFVSDAGPTTVALAGRWSVPTLLQWAEDDRFVDPWGARTLAAQAPAAAMQGQAWPGYFHEIFNETPERAEPVFALLRDWLQQRWPARG